MREWLGSFVSWVRLGVIRKFHRCLGLSWLLLLSATD